MPEVSGLLRRAWERAAAPFGSRRLDRMLRDGLPSSLEAPLRFLFNFRAPAETEEAVQRIERIRREIAARPDVFEYTVYDTPLGPRRVPARVDPAKALKPVPSRWFANNASVPQRWGTFLHLCAAAFEARMILEMGACIGMSGSYLASAPSKPRLVTLDGSPDLAAIAKETIAGFTNNFELVLGPFVETLPSTLARLGDRIDLAYVDGHHDEAATLHYVRTLLPCLATPALVVLDDIHLFREMWRAWRTLAATPGVTAAVNVGRFGLLVWAGGDGTPRDYDLSRYTGWWRVGGARKDAIGA